MDVRERSNLEEIMERGVDKLLNNFSVEDYIAENLDDNSVKQVLQAANVLGESGFVEVAERLHIGIARYNKNKNKN